MADRPWLMRTYSGHSTARASNELYRTNLAKGQTGLSIAFDLPTQTGYDPDHILAQGEVGKVGVPIAHRGNMAALLEGIPLDEMNTSMTINAPAAWLLALYLVDRRETGGRLDQTPGNHPERHRQGIPEPGDLHLRARGQSPSDRRSLRVLLRARSRLEPDERLQLPPARGRGHPGPGDRLFPRHRHRRPRCDQGIRSGGRRPLHKDRRQRQLLREQRNPVRGGSRQDAGLHPTLGSTAHRPVRNHR